jgi:hypothetical protein
VIRALALPALAAAGAAALALAATAALLDSPPPFRWPGWSAALLAAGAAGLLHDPARELIVATPVGMRHALRIALGLALATPCWVGVLAISGAGAERTVECGGMVAAALAVAAVIGRRGDDGRAAATLAPVVVAGFLMGRSTLTWGALAVVAAAAATWACRD